MNTNTSCIGSEAIGACLFLYQKRQQPKTGGNDQKRPETTENGRKQLKTAENDQKRPKRPRMATAAATGAAVAISKSFAKNGCDLVNKKFYLPPKRPSMPSIWALGLGLGTPIFRGKPQNMVGNDLKNQKNR